MPHRVCLACGKYRKKEIINLSAKLEKEAKKSKARAKEGVKKDE